MLLALGSMLSLITSLSESNKYHSGVDGIIFDSLLLDSNSECCVQLNNIFMRIDAKFAPSLSYDRPNLCCFISSKRSILLCCIVVVGYYGSWHSVDFAFIAPCNSFGYSRLDL